MRRFFVKPILKTEPLINLDREESHHVVKVLRLPAGEEIELLDGLGNLYQGRIETIGRQVSVRILSMVRTDPETKPSLWVCQGGLKGKKMDFVVQKCTELGVDRFLPYTSGRSQGRNVLEYSEKKHERWEKLVKSACKQSMRLKLMQVEPEQSITDLLTPGNLPESITKIMFWEEERQTRLADLDWRAPADRVCLMLGPEGGFALQEVAEAQQQGWRIVSLGKNVLRAETATVSAVSIVQHLLGVI